MVLQEMDTHASKGVLSTWDTREVHAQRINASLLHHILNTSSVLVVSLSCLQ